LAKGWPLAGLVALGVGSVVTLGGALWAWCRRRLGLRIDEVGIHELFPGGRVVTHPWEECREPFGETKGVLRFWSKAHGRYVRFGRRMEDARTLAAFLNNRLLGRPVADPSEIHLPGPEQIAEWLGVPVEELPVRFRLSWSREEDDLFDRLLMLLLMPLGWYLHVRLGLALWLVMTIIFVGILALSSVLRDHFKRFWSYLEVDGKGLRFFFWPRRRSFMAWEDLLIEGRNQDLDLTSVIERDRLRDLIDRVLKACGPIPETALRTGPQATDASLSRARPPEATPTATGRALSRATVEEEDDRPRLSAEVTEPEQEVSEELRRR
jgi:hypothetical protein